MFVHSIFIALFSLITSVSYAQLDSNKTFELSKGKWRVPIDSFKVEIKSNKGWHGLNACELNYGLSFKSTYPSPIYSVHDGKVVATFCIGEYTGVIIQYGSYYMTYSGLFDCYLKKHDQVKATTIIGRLQENNNKEFELEFILSKESKYPYPLKTWFENYPE